jgi:hypothetical protein
MEKEITTMEMEVRNLYNRMEKRISDLEVNIIWKKQDIEAGKGNKELLEADIKELEGRKQEARITLLKIYEIIK